MTVVVWRTRTRSGTKRLPVIVVVADDLKRLGAVQCIVWDGMSKGNDEWVEEWEGILRWRDGQ